MIPCLPQTAKLLEVDAPRYNGGLPGGIANWGKFVVMEFVEGPIDGVVIHSLGQHCDARGWLIELFRADELPGEGLPAMAYVSETLPGVTRGPHEHREQADLFAFVGPGEFRLYLWDTRPSSPTAGNRASFDVGSENRCRVIVPPGVVHAYKNTGVVPGWVFNAPNRLYAGKGRAEAVDEIRHEDNATSEFVMD